MSPHLPRAAAPQVDVVIPVRNDARGLRRCLDALAAQDGAAPFEVTVVDNASTDSTAEVARAHPVVTRVVSEPARGSYAARNAGLAATSSPVVAFTDADCVPAARWLAAGVAAIESGADAVGGAVRSLRSARPTTWERFDRAVYLQQEQTVREQGFAATANLFVRRDVFDVVGRFDAALRSGGDLEWGQRFVAAGLRLDYAAEARVDHRPRTTFGQTWRLHERLGSGWGQLSRDGRRPPARDEPALHVGFQWVVEQVAADGPPVPRWRLRLVHRIAKAARWSGHLRGRRG